MDCDNLLKAINQYVDGEADPSICARLEAHLSDCEACRVVVDTLARTVKLYKGDAVVEEVPFEVKRRLRDTLAARWRQKQKGER